MLRVATSARLDHDAVRDPGGNQATSGYPPAEVHSELAIFSTSEYGVVDMLSAPLSQHVVCSVEARPS